MLKLINSVVLGNGIMASEVMDTDTGVSYLIGSNHDGGMCCQNMIDRSGKIKWNEDVVREKSRENWCDIGKESRNKETNSSVNTEENNSNSSVDTKKLITWQIDDVLEILTNIKTDIKERLNEVRT